MNIDDVQTVYNAVLEAGEEFGVGDFGTYAMNTLRLEKGFRAWGAEVSLHEKSQIYNTKAHIPLRTAFALGTQRRKKGINNMKCTWPTQKCCVGDPPPPIFHWKWGSRWLPNANEIYTKKKKWTWPTQEIGVT